jgi:CelD/BcsL family acetyltransferase involved in cellulose biosynthesis
MSSTITEESFDWLTSFWKDHGHELRWDNVFVLPPWLKVWQKTFAPETKPYFLTGRQEEKVTGIAPLLIKDRTASIIGSADVCDYVDFIVAPGKEGDFFKALLDDLKGRNVNLLDLGALRPDSATNAFLIDTARKTGYEATCEEEDLSLERDLPPTWDEYLKLLNSKQRHEVRRKLRRLAEAGSINYRFVDKAESVPDFMDTFLKMFVESREDKAEFLTEQMADFFKSMAGAMAEAGLLRAGILEVDDKPVAAIIAFDYNDIVYLYNSAYDPNYSSLSVGVLSKALYIKDSIERGKKRFDFLKGTERYKYHLGGTEVHLSRCRIKIG